MFVRECALRSLNPMMYPLAGPLVWHYHDTPGEVSIELSWSELRAVITHAGFEIEAPDTSHEGTPHMSAWDVIM